MSCLTDRAGIILILGMGASGRAMTEALARAGQVVRAADERTDLDREGLPPDSHLGPMGTELLEGVAVVATSPGLSPSHPLLQTAVQRGLSVWSEPELAVRLNAGRTRLVGVTGTNGKTTTTQMIAACLDAPAAGNIGIPLVTTLTVDPPPLVVAELSSFQLHFCSTLRPDVAVLLNVADDHLDWHGGMDPYRGAKARMWQAQRAEDVTVVLGSDAGAMATVDRWPPPGRLVTAHVGDDVLDPSTLVAPGPHNAANATVAAHAAIAAGGDPDMVRDTLATFSVGDHRMEHVATLDGVDYVNDSKATNPHAALAALHSYADIVWIAGGLNKGLSFETLAPAMRERVRFVLTIGRCGPEVAAMAREAGVPTEEVGDLVSAVRRSREIAVPGVTVLLAPAAASMDQFTDYADRGQQFRSAVESMR